MYYRISRLYLVRLAAAPLIFFNTPLGFGVVHQADPDTAKLQLEVNALSSLCDLKLTPDQVAELKAMISDTPGQMLEPPAAINDKLKAALKESKAAYLSKDAKKIEAAQSQLEVLQDQQDADSDLEVEQSQAAKDKAPAFLKMLSVKQLANYISQMSDTMDDPAQILLDAVHQVQKLSDDDFASLRDDTSERIGIFFGALRGGKPLPIVAKVNRLLTQVHHLSANDYRNQQSALETQARGLISDVDPVLCLRHWLDNELADLLSNPQLGQALTDLGMK